MTRKIPENTRHLSLDDPISPRKYSELELGPDPTSVDDPISPRKYSELELGPDPTSVDDPISPRQEHIIPYLGTPRLITSQEFRLIK